MGMTRGRYLPGSSTDRILNSYKAVEFVPPQTAEQVAAAAEQVAAAAEQVAAAAERPPSRRDDVYYPATRFERLQPYHDKRFNNPLFDSRYPGIKFADTTHFSGAEIRAKELRDIQEGIEKEEKEKEEKEKEEMIGLSLLNQLNQTDGGKRERERKKKSSRRQTRRKKQQQQRRHRTRRNSSRKYKK
jgi:hypothetical protein